MEEYGDLMDYVSTISTVLTGEETDKVKQMKHVSEVIDDGVKDKTVKTEAFYVTYSGGTYKVGNIGSLANSMIIAAGGHSITTSDTDAKPTYGRNITDLVDAHPNAVIFIDASIVKDHKDDFYSKLGDAHNKVVELKPLWNNYCIESMNGVWTMACAMYPDAFSGDVPEVEKDKNDNTMLYVAIGGAAAAAVIVVGLLFLRKH